MTCHPPRRSIAVDVDHRNRLRVRAAGRLFTIEKTVAIGIECGVVDCRLQLMGDLPAVKHGIPVSIGSLWVGVVIGELIGILETIAIRIHSSDAFDVARRIVPIGDYGRTVHVYRVEAPKVIILVLVGHGSTMGGRGHDGQKEKSMYINGIFFIDTPNRLLLAQYQSRLP